ncbi:hypothetical protein FB384_002081 [Prauserella sediminis]|uniref:Asp23/Gls24 family envelope stress response protein n=1 Tax=Prauserella sediminis TaxID=577680 RepID=A0A839XKS1_9PSEU|nr:Asp23/Gls24 family envelope stress response protein [Prauserella sediminis]MBB3663177.1 hypothetical protein [Prauserella sediminis]
MALSPGTDTYRLPCGRNVERLWEDLDAPDEHGTSCPHCQASRASLQLLRQATGELVADEAGPPAGLTARIMAAVRADIRRRDLLELPTTEPGAARISAQAAATILRFAADTVEGVRARHCRVDLDATGAVVELNIAVDSRTFTHPALEQVRQRVETAASRRIGWPTVTLHLTMTDVFEA